MGLGFSCRRPGLRLGSPQTGTLLAAMQLAVNILVLAAIYALIGCGYVVVYRVSRVMNLAHGELMMLGPYLLLATAAQFQSHWLLAIAAAVSLSLLTGVLVYVLLMRKM